MYRPCHALSFIRSVWAPGLRRVLIHTSGGEVDGLTRCISSQLLRKLSKWLKQARANRVNEPIDDEDWKTHDPHSFCGTGYCIVTTFENLRRNADIYTSHDFSYVLLDEAQKIKNPDAVSLKEGKRKGSKRRPVDFINFAIFHFAGYHARVQADPYSA